MSLVIVDPGLATTVQDAGRPGFAHLGVSQSGTVDPELAATLNRLVGNPPTAALLETVGGLRVRARRPLVVATDGELAPRHLSGGAELTVAAGGDRQWHYLAVGGGLATAVTLGSRSHDTLSGIGATPIVPGGELPVSLPHPSHTVVDIARIPTPSATVTISAGPRFDWFDDDAARILTTTEWRVTASSRVGVRLRGARIGWRIERELPSEGLVRGAIQVPPDGDPVMMLADHPTTGGYPVIAVVAEADVAAVAQRLAGSPLRFRMRSPS